MTDQNSSKRIEIENNLFILQLKEALAQLQESNQASNVVSREIKVSEEEIKDSIRGQIEANGFHFTDLDIYGIHIERAEIIKYLKTTVINSFRKFLLSQEFEEILLKYFEPKNNVENLKPGYIRFANDIKIEDMADFDSYNGFSESVLAFNYFELGEMSVVTKNIDRLGLKMKAGKTTEQFGEEIIEFFQSKSKEFVEDPINQIPSVFCDAVNKRLKAKADAELKAQKQEVPLRKPFKERYPLIYALFGNEPEDLNELLSRISEFLYQVYLGGENMDMVPGLQKLLKEAELFIDEYLKGLFESTDEAFDQEISTLKERLMAERNRLKAFPDERPKVTDLNMRLQALDKFVKRVKQNHSSLLVYIITGLKEEKLDDRISLFDGYLGLLGVSEH